MGNVPSVATEEIHCPSCGSDLAANVVFSDVTTGEPIGEAPSEFARSWIQTVRKGTNYYPVVGCPDCGEKVSLARNQEIAARGLEE